MTMAEHTKLPWIVTTCLDLWIEPAERTGDPDGFHGIAHCGDISWPGFREKQREWEANARLIVKAVNNHERLVAALKQATDNLNMARLGMDAESRKLAGELVNEYRALLAEIDR